MWSFENVSIKQKLNAIAIATTGVTLVFAFIALLAYDTVRTRQNIARNLSIMAETVANNSTAALSFKDQKSAEEALGVFKANRHVRQAAVYDAHARIFADYQI